MAETQDKIKVMLELEKLGGLPKDKQVILDELRSLGAVPALDSAPKQSEIPGAKTRQQNTKFVKSLALPQLGAFGGGVLGALGAGIPTLGAGAVGGATVGAGIFGGLGKSAEIALMNLLANRGTQSPFKQTLQSGVDAATNQMIGESIIPGAKIIGKGVSKIPGVSSALGSVKKFAGNIGQGLSTSSFVQPAKDVEKALLKGKETLGQEAAKRGIYGFKRSVLNLLTSKTKDIGSQIDLALDAVSKEKISPSIIAKEAQEIQSKSASRNRINFWNDFFDSASNCVSVFKAVLSDCFSFCHTLLVFSFTFALA